MYQLSRLFRPLVRASVEVLLIFFRVAKYSAWHLNLAFAGGLYLFFFAWLIPGLREWQLFGSEPEPGVGQLFYWLMTHKQEKVFLAVEGLAYLLIAFFIIYGLSGLVRAVMSRGRPRATKGRTRAGYSSGPAAVYGLSQKGMLDAKALDQVGSTMRVALSWHELESGLYALGLELQPKGSGLVLRRFKGGEVIGPLSGLGIGVSYVTLKKRLGNPPSHLTPDERFAYRSGAAS